jgi:hypothetical protein
MTREAQALHALLPDLRATWARTAPIEDRWMLGSIRDAVSAATIMVPEARLATPLEAVFPTHDETMPRTAAA